MATPLNLILIGPPGAGKGTQATRLRDELRFPIVSTGEILRANVTNATRLGIAAQAHMNGGSLVPDDLVVAMATERLEQQDVSAGCILDGFPRTTVQADALMHQLLKRRNTITCALLLDTSDAEIIARIAGRRICVETGHSYHVEHAPPTIPGVCDQDGSALVLRDDDKPSVVEKRLEVYHEQTAPLIDYYSHRKLLHRIDGTGSPSEVYERIVVAVTALRASA